MNRLSKVELWAYCYGSEGQILRRFQKRDPSFSRKLTWKNWLCLPYAALWTTKAVERRAKKAQARIRDRVAMQRQEPC